MLSQLLALALSSVLTPQHCGVTRIVDGDTFVCGNTKVRLLLVDAPEMHEGAPGLAAKKQLQKLLPIGAEVELELDRRKLDKYGRTLAYVWNHKEMVNEAMARRGFAVALAYKPNVRYLSAITKAEASAKRRKAGLWATNAFDCLPRDFRAHRCQVK